MTHLRVVTLNETQEKLREVFGELRHRVTSDATAFVEDGMLVVRVRGAVWWVEVYSPVGVPPRVDSEMAPYRALTNALAAHRELSLWALGGTR